MKLMKKFLSTTIVALILLSMSLSILAKPTQAQTNPWYKQDISEWMAKVGDESNPTEIFGERYTAAQVRWVLYGLFYTFIDMTGDGDTVACIMDPANQPTTDSNGNEDHTTVAAECGALVTESLARYVNAFIADSGESQNYYAFNGYPVSSLEYFKDAASRVNLVSEVNAQGFGFTAVNPVLELWRTSRNMTYVLMVLVIIAMAFMIMFRVKLSPQTVISVQTALPRVVITLILITFSYAIAGLLIDIMYVVIGLIAALFTSGTDPISELPWNELFSALTDWSAPAVMFYYFILFVLAALTAIPLLTLAWFGISISTGGFGFLITLIPVTIFLIFYVYKSIKIMFTLIKSFVFILLGTAFAPFWILLGALGGRMGFSSWLKFIASNLAIYPVVGVMFVLSFLFLMAAIPPWIVNIINTLGIDVFFGTTNQLSATSWSPPFTLGTSLFAGRILYIIVSFSIIMLTPRAADIIKSAIQGREFAYGSAISGEAAALGAMAGTVISPVRWAGRSASGAVSKRFGDEFTSRTGTALRGTRFGRFLGATDGTSGGNDPAGS